ncbi:MAG: UDP-N-acetylmuramoyl-tripeptide--D-alanyl-D-alanine ligase [Vulcanimicrobiaceae bacterium]|jgi:UDP-N-acetylmuramoyl-tripeptide--D-alanyl-D-alanine ligase
MRFSFGEVCDAVGGRPVGQPPSQTLRIVTDTRQIEPGDAFVALRGENFDGGDFTGDAFAKGAVLAIVTREDLLAGKPGIVVEDTLRAYMALGAAARAHSNGIVIAITGSTGKTTTKALLAQLLSFSGKKLAATPQNENNQVGVSKLLLALDGDEQVVVVEMGARHAGEIAELCAIAMPHLGILTNIGEAHLEVFETRERLADTKWGLFSTGAIAILNVADEESRRRFGTLPRAPGWFGAGETVFANVLLPATLIPARDGIVFADAAGYETFSISTSLPGDHNLSNLAAAATAARAVGMTPPAIVEAIPKLTLPPGRYERMSLQGGVHLVYDAYNASLSGTLATLRAFSSENAERRIAVLGGMAELGVESPQMHEEIGASLPGCGIDVVLIGGEHADSTIRGAVRAGMSPLAIVPYESNAHATQWLRVNMREGDSILLKGSRMYKMEEILGGLKALRQ